MAPAKQVALLPPFSFQLLLVTAQSAEEEDDEESEGEDHQENEKKWEAIGDAEGHVQISVGKSGGGNVDAIEQTGNGKLVAFLGEGEAKNGHGSRRSRETKGNKQASNNYNRILHARLSFP